MAGVRLVLGVGGQPLLEAGAGLRAQRVEPVDGLPGADLLEDVDLFQLLLSESASTSSIRKGGISSASSSSATITSPTSTVVPPQEMVTSMSPGRSLPASWRA